MFPIISRVDQSISEYHNCDKMVIQTHLKRKIWLILTCKRPILNYRSLLLIHFAMFFVIYVYFRTNLNEDLEIVHKICSKVSVPSKNEYLLELPLFMR